MHRKTSQQHGLHPGGQVVGLSRAHLAGGVALQKVQFHRRLLARDLLAVGRSSPGPVTVWVK